jgi:hypothetical protein
VRGNYKYAAIWGGFLAGGPGFEPGLTENKRGVRYRYYVSHAILQNRKAEAGNIARVPAPEIETLACEGIRRHLAAMGDGEPAPATADRDLIERHVEFLGYALRLASGYLSDRTGSYWLITIIGYGVQSLGRAADSLDRLRLPTRVAPAGSARPVASTAARPMMACLTPSGMVARLI